MQYIKYECTDRIAHITLNRPEKRNALNHQVVAELKEAFDKAAKDSNAKVIILKAEGKAFCAGADLQYLQQLQKNTFEENLEDSSHLKELFYKIYTHPKVVIAQVQGHAIAGGCGLATVCDIVFSVPEALYGYTEVRIGFIPAIVSLFLVRKIGEAKAKELLLSGELIKAPMAKDLGMINFTESPETLEASVLEYAQMLCNKNSLQAMQTTKHMIAEVQDMTLAKALEYAAEQNAKARESEDCKKGIQAFLSKEKLTW